MKEYQVVTYTLLLYLQKGNETPRPEPVENAEVNNQVGQVSEELTRVTRYRAPDPIVDDPIETVKPYTSVKCSKEAKEVCIDLKHTHNMC